jgi:hypothetical protein
MSLPMKKYVLGLCTLLAALAAPALAQRPSEAPNSLLGASLAANHHGRAGLSVFGEYRTAGLRNRLGVGGYVSFFSQPGQQHGLGVGARLAYHFVDRRQWGAYLGANLGYGYSSASRPDWPEGRAVAWGTTFRPLVGARAYVSERVGLHLELNSAGILERRVVSNDLAPSLLLGVAVRL